MTTEQQFAAFTWQTRWNKSEAVAALSQGGPHVMATGFFGYVLCDLRKTEDIAAIVNQARRFADMLEDAKRRYDEALT